MGRAILAVIVSYVSMFVLAFLAFVGAYLILGADQAFKPRLFQASNRWIALAFAIQIVVSIIGGLICAAIAKGGKAPVALAILVLVIGLGLAIPELAKRRANEKAVRTGSTSNIEAM